MFCQDYFKKGKKTKKVPISLRAEVLCGNDLFNSSSTVLKHRYRNSNLTGYFGSDEAV